MKYLKPIFEKFDSTSLTKVLGFISKESRSKFLSEIKNLFEKLDFPISKLSDDMFDYMKFSKAYSLYNSDKSEYLKFWFTSSGEYVGSTKQSDEILLGKGDTINYKLLPNLSKVSIGLGESKRTYVDAVIYKSSDGWYYAINNDRRFNGTSPHGDSNWVKFGLYAWQLGHDDSDPNVRPLIPVDVKDPDYFNLPLNPDMQSNTVKEFLKDAEFCLVIDLKSLPGIKKSDIKKKRESIKADSTTSLISRNIDTLSKYEIDGDVDQLTPIVPRILGWSNPLLFIYFDINIGYIESIQQSIKYKDRVELSSAIKESIIRSFKISENVSKCMTTMKKSKSEKVSKFIEIFNSLESLTKQYLFKDFTSISDLISLRMKIKIINDLSNKYIYFYGSALNFIKNGQPKEAMSQIEINYLYEYKMIEMIDILKSLLK